MADYARVANGLHLVRRAWKRTAALSGLAIVVLETAGLLTVAFLVDILYRPMPEVRMVLFAAVVAAALFLAARHMFRPLARRIPDEQIALYVEEHSPQFEGALVAAAEFRQGHWLSDQQAALVDAIIASAAARAEKIDLRTVLDLSRLRKYGVAAALVIGCYVAASVLFPSSLGRHVARVLQPWHQTDEDRARYERIRLEKLPITFVLSRGDTSLLRGSPFALEVELSRASTHPVLLHFRPAAGGEKARWQTLPMKEIEKLNGFRGELADVNEDMEFAIATDRYESSPHRITVYDPLVLEGVEVTTEFPSYLRLPKRVEVQSGGDAMVPIGSKVTVRVLTNRPLRGGTLAWEDGSSLPLDPVVDRRESAAAAFTVEKNASFTFAVEDVMGQRAESPGPSFVRAIKDAPPTLELKYPTEALYVHPLGEVTFVADAADDFGIKRIELVTLRGLDRDAKEVRVPLHAARLEDAVHTSGGSVRATLNYRLEDVTPRLQPEESVAYYLECSDRKGQKAITDIFLVTVKHFETWATWDTHPPEEHEGSIQSLEPYFKATWHLHTQKDQLNEADFKRQAAELADSMLDPETGQRYVFAYTKDKSKLEALAKANAAIDQGHQALRAADTETAVASFRVALALIATFDLAPNQLQIIPEGSAPPDSQRNQQLEVAAIEAARMEKELDLQAPQEGAINDAQQAQQNAEEARTLEREQSDVVEKTRELAENQQGEQRPEGQPDTPQENEAARGVAEKQETVAEKAKQVAQNVQQDALAQDDDSAREAASKLDRAAAEMQRAARQLREGRFERALAEAERAQRSLREAAEELGGVEQAQLERALDDAETRAEQILDRQRDIRAQAQQVAEQIDHRGQDAQPNPEEQRDLKVAGTQQARLRAETSQLQQDVDQIQKWADKGARPETKKAVEEAAQTIRRGRVEQRMTNAVVELAGAQPRAAAEQQQQAEKGLERTLDRIRAANDSLASDIQSELRRARNEARRIEDQVADLGRDPKPQRPEPGDTKQGETRPDASKKGEDQPAPAQPKPQLSPREAEARGEKLAYDIRRFVKHVENRDFASQDEVTPLRQAAEEPRGLGNELRRDEKKHAELLEAARRLRNKLEKEYESSLEAKRLFAAQREECPPQYRQLVNQYYEALSKR